MDLQLRGKRALITGSSKGIGEAIARYLAAEGASVLVHGLDRQAAEKVADSTVQQGGEAHAVTGDLTDESAIGRLVATVEDKVGYVEILVNKAGGSGPKETWATTQPDPSKENFS